MEFLEFFTVERVKSFYEKTGAIPWPGYSLYVAPGNGEIRACPIGVAGLAKSLVCLSAIPPDTASQLIERLIHTGYIEPIGATEVHQFIAGFDSDRLGHNPSAYRMRGYELREALV